MEPTTGQISPARPGRKRDHSRDAAILDAALDVLMEHGYERMTMDTVAARARAGKATMYRRWPSKAHLVADAVARMNQLEVDLEQLPDTGSLREDLVGLITRESLGSGERRLKVMAGMASALVPQNDPVLVAALAGAGSELWIDANRIFIRRAVERGELPGGVDLEIMARVIPSMCHCRVVVEGQRLTADYILTLIDQVLLPALARPE